MRALEVQRLSDDFSGVRVVERARPRPRAGEVRVRMRAAGVNFPDLLMAQGGYQLKPDLPFVPGMEFAGEVSALGAGASAPPVGARCAASVRLGAFAEEVCVPAEAVRPLPPELSFAEGASYRTALLTAYVGLVCRGKIQRGETLLVLGAAGGVGLAAVQLGRHLGARVIAVASSDAKRAALPRFGAAHCLAPSPHLGKEVKALTDGAGAALVYDPVGGDQFDWAQRAIGWGGRYLVIGFAAGRIPSLAVNYPLIKGYAVIGVRAGEYGRRDPEAGAKNIAAVDALVARPDMRPHVHAHFALEDWREAFALLQTRAVIGKACLTA